MILKKTLILAGLAAVASSALFSGCDKPQYPNESVNLDILLARAGITNDGRLYLTTTNTPEITKQSGYWQIRIR